MSNDLTDRNSPSSALKGDTQVASEIDGLNGSEDSGALQTAPDATLTWQSLLPHAIGRLRDRARELQLAADEAVPMAVESKTADFDADFDTGLDDKHDIDFDDDFDAESGEEPSAQALEVAKAFNAQVEHSDEDSSSASSLFRSKLSGIIASAIAHVVLIVFLAFVTLKMPKPPAGMAFASAPVESAEESVELVQPIEASEPDASEPTEPSETQLDLTSDLTAVSSSTLSDAIGEMAPPTDMVSSAAMSAVSSAIPSTSSASFFGAAAGGNNFCYVIDCSGSMKGGPWEAARAELLKSLASLKPQQRFYIILFGREIEALPEPGEQEPASFALYASKENLDHARRWLMSINVAGRAGASPKNAISMAVEKEPDCIYLLTDGVTRVKDVAEFIREQNRVYDIINGEQVKAPIHTIAYYSLDGQKLLRQIASENRGQFIYVPDPTKRK